MRPLTEKMERYARNDTHYLKPVSDELRTQLKAKGRLKWHEESCARLIAESTKGHQPDRDSAWRIKGSHLLGRPALAVLRELWEWRESEAIAANKPPFFVLSHQILVDIAAAAATDRPVEGLYPRHLSDRRRRELSKAVKRGMAVPAAEYPEIPRNSGRRANEAEKKRFLELQNRRDARARELEIDPTLVASRSVLSDLAHNWDKNAPLLMKWQHELLTQ
jgi:ribonuclease D